MAVRSIRALFQSLFDEDNDDDSSNMSPTDRSRASPPRRRMGSNAIQPTQLWGTRLRTHRGSASAHSVGSAASANSACSNSSSETEYTPRAADGEYTAWFQRRPLGLGLVPSTQLYGSWEVSSVSAAITRERESGASDHVTYDDTHSRSRNRTLRVARGDVVLAINHSHRRAHLRREQLGEYLQACALPIAVTLRKPALYAALDSHSVATAMYPLSSDYGAATAAAAGLKRFTARASSAQWQRTLQHELSHNARQAKSRDAQTRALALAGARSSAGSRTPSERSASASSSPRRKQQQAVVPKSQPLPSKDQKIGKRGATSPTKSSGDAGSNAGTTADTYTDTLVATAIISDSRRDELSPMGEFTLAFDEHPLALVLAPSTRHYGSVEVYDAKHHAPQLHVGDVVMAVNGDASVSRWATDDLIDFIEGLFPPVAITFRRPAAYRQYLEQFFRTSKSSSRAMSSHSVAHAMFPQSAEYRKSPPKVTARKRLDSGSPLAPPLPPRLSVSTRGLISNSTLTSSALRGATISPAHRRVLSCEVPAAPPTTSRELASRTMRDFSFQIDATEQFKPWNGGGRDGAAQTSSILTERHVRFLWRSLPAYLGCNGMELAYSTRYHGWNTLSFYAKLANCGPTILVVQDTRDNIFGAFCATSWRESTTIYGNGRSFVFTLRPQLQAFPWSGHESSFMYSRRDAVFVGGGVRGIALCLQLDDMRGFSTPCDTFDSPGLSDRADFECEICEVWSFSGLRI